MLCKRKRLLIGSNEMFSIGLRKAQRKYGLKLNNENNWNFNCTSYRKIMHRNDKVVMSCYVSVWKEIMNVQNNVCACAFLFFFFLFFGNGNVGQDHFVFYVKSSEINAMVPRFKVYQSFSIKGCHVCVPNWIFFFFLRLILLGCQQIRNHCFDLWERIRTLNQYKIIYTYFSRYYI